MSKGDDQDAKITSLNRVGLASRRSFIGWQCRIRQMSVRRAGGRPSDGMRPRVLMPPAGADAGRIVVLIRKKNSAVVTHRFRHMVRRTRDPAERRQSALDFLAAEYYQQPDSFSDEMTALFGPRSEHAAQMLEAGRCTLAFEQSAECHRLTVRVEELERTEEAFQFTFWHNSLFNPDLPADVRILAFRPDWTQPL